MEISSDDSNTDLNSCSVTDTTFESVKDTKILISPSDVGIKFRNWTRRIDQVLLVVIFVAIIVALLLTFTNYYNGYDQLRKNDTTYDKKEAQISDTPLDRPNIVEGIEMNESATQPAPRVCVSDEECTHSANHLIQSMNLTVDPCQDFYKFSCGGWEKMLNDSPPTKTFDDIGEINQYNLMDMRIKNDVLELLQDEYFNTNNEAFKMARNVYKSCMNTGAIKEAGKAPLIQLLDSYGGWPIITPSWNESNFDWKKVSSSLLIQFGIHIFFNITTTIDSENKDNNIIFITPSNVPDDEPLGKIKNLISDRFLPDITESEVFKRDLDELNKFRVELKYIADLNTIHYNLIWYLSSLQTLTDKLRGTMDWANYLNEIFSVLNAAVDRYERITANVFYLSDLFKLLNKTSPRVIANYVHWKIVASTIGDTEDGLLNLDRGTFCFFKMRLMEPAIIPEYVKKYFPPDQRREIMQIVNNLKSNFLKTFHDEEEMSMQISSMKALVGYPDWIDNETFLNSHYGELKVGDDRSYFQNICNLKRFLAINNLKSIRRERFMDYEDQLFLMASPNAYYFDKSNKIIIPLILLRPPFYRKGGPMAPNYGFIGSTIGHEMGHGIFTAKQKQLRPGFSSLAWMYKPFNWTKAAKVRNQNTCFIRQYNNYKIDELNKNLSGENTLNDNVADNIGVTQTFRAYQSYVAVNGAERRLPGLEQFSPEQIFFISYANKYCVKYASIKELNKSLLNDEHTVAPYRIIAALSNSEEFSQHFKCPLNSRMNPVNKCSFD